MDIQAAGTEQQYGRLVGRQITVVLWESFQILEEEVSRNIEAREGKFLITKVALQNNSKLQLTLLDNLSVPRNDQRIILVIDFAEPENLTTFNSILPLKSESPIKLYLKDNGQNKSIAEQLNQYTSKLISFIALEVIDLEQQNSLVFPPPSLLGKVLNSKLEETKTGFERGFSQMALSVLHKGNIPFYLSAINIDFGRRFKNNQPLDSIDEIIKLIEERVKEKQRSFEIPVLGNRVVIIKSDELIWFSAVMSRSDFEEMASGAPLHFDMNADDYEGPLNEVCNDINAGKIKFFDHRKTAGPDEVVMQQGGIILQEGKVIKTILTREYSEGNRLEPEVDARELVSKKAIYIRLIATINVSEMGEIPNNLPYDFNEVVIDPAGVKRKHQYAQRPTSAKKFYQGNIQTGCYSWMMDEFYGMELVGGFTVDGVSYQKPIVAKFLFTDSLFRQVSNGELTVEEAAQRFKLPVIENGEGG